MNAKIVCMCLLYYKVVMYSWLCNYVATHKALIATQNELISNLRYKSKFLPGACRP